MIALSLDKTTAAYRRALLQLEHLFRGSAMPAALRSHGLQIIKDARQRVYDIEKTRDR